MNLIPTLKRQEWAWRLFAATLVLTALIAPQVNAATDVMYMPATGHYMRGVFRDFWEQNGGLANFGYPLTEEYSDTRSGRVYQYFERARFERARPDSKNISLGLLGRESTVGRSFAPVQSIKTTSQRRYFTETQHIVQYGFKEIWETRGGLSIFGLPLSEEIQEQLADGQIHTVQYFERTRFEYWGNLAAGQRVVLGTLGRQFAPRDLTAPLPPNAPPSPLPTPGTPTPPPPPPPPSLTRPIIPESKNARVNPQAGTPGQIFLLEATGYLAGETVSVWLNAPNGSVLSTDIQATADSSGAVHGSAVQFQSEAQSPIGVWSIVGQGMTSGRQAIGYFRLLGSSFGRAPSPGPGVPPNIDARSDPPAGPAGTVFFFDASGFTSGEDVQMAIIASDGRRTEADFTIKADTKGAIGFAGIYYATAPGYSLGLYSFVATGKTSRKISTAYFVLTP